MPSNEVMRDEAVLEMQIDNKQFVRGAEKTIGVLDKLKDALSFKHAGDGFKDLQKSVDIIRLDGLAKDVEEITKRFSTMGQVGMNVIKNLTDSVYNFVKRTVTSLTIDPITSGFNQFGELTKSIDTVVAATREEIIPKEYATQMEYVNDQMDRLMWFTDETSYSLQDMTSNIGKFTNAGVPLWRALQDMEGVATWAGMSGASIQEASRAMYNLSQAIAVGSVKLMDWRSIENANMATREFKQTAIDTAVSVGTLTKQVQKGGKVVYKTMQGNLVTAENFNEALSDGWFNAEVLERSLLKYGQFASDLNEVMEDLSFTGNGVYAGDVLAWLDEIDAADDKKAAIQAWHDELMEETDLYEQGLLPSVKALTEAYETLTSKDNELGRRAFVASQAYKTFQDVLDATADAVRTGWTKTFRYILGDSEQAKALWKGIGDEFYDIFVAAGDRRNKILKLWALPDKNGITGRDSLLEALKNLYYGIRTYIDPVITALHNVFSLGNTKEAAQKLRAFTDRFLEFSKKIALSEKTMRGITNAIEALFRLIPKARAKINSLLKTIVPGYEHLNKILPKALGYLKDFVILFFDAFSDKEKGFNWEFFKYGAADIFDRISESIQKLWKSIKKFGDGVKDVPVVGTVFSKMIGAVESLNGLLTKSSEETSDMEEGTGFLEGALDHLTKFWDALVKTVGDVNEGLGTLWDWLKLIGDRVEDVWKVITNDDPNSVSSRITAFIDGIVQGFRDSLKTITFSDIVSGIRDGIFLYIAYEFTRFVKTIKGTAKEFNTVWESFGGVFRSLSSAISSYGKAQNANYMLKMAAAVAILAGSMFLLALVPERKIITVAAALAILFGVMSSIMKHMSKMGRLFGGNIKNENSGNTTFSGSNTMLSGNNTTFTIFSNLAQNLIALAIFIVSVAWVIKQLKVVKTEEYFVAMAYIVGVIIAAVAAIGLLSMVGKDLKAASLLPLIGVALVILALGHAFSKVENIDIGKIAAVGTAMVAIMLALGFAMVMAKEMSINAGAGIFVTVLAMLLGLYGIIPVIFAIDLYIKKMGDERLIEDFMVLVGAGVVLTAFAAIMAKIGKSPGALKGAGMLTLIGAAFVLFAAALVIAVPAIITLLTGIFTVLTLFTDFGTANGGFTALWEAVGIFLMLSAASMLLGYGIKLLGEGLMKAGVGFVAFSAGAFLLAAAAALITVVLVPLGNAIVGFCQLLIDNAAVIIGVVAMVITGVITAIAASKMHIAYTLISVILTILVVIHQYGPQIINVLYVIVEDIFKFAFELIPLAIAFIAAAIITILNGVANALRANQAAVLEAIENIISVILELIVNAVIRGTGILTSLLGGLWQKIKGKNKEEIDAWIKENNEYYEAYGASAADGIYKAFGEPGKEAMEQSADDMWLTFFDRDSHKASEGAFDELAGMVKENLVPKMDDAGDAGANAFFDGANTTLVEGASNLKDSITSNFTDQFNVESILSTQSHNGSAGFINAGYEDLPLYSGLANDQMDAYLTTIANRLQLGSPSKLMRTYGQFTTEGFIIGLNDGSDDVVSAGDSLAIKMVDAVRNALTTVQAMTDQDFDLHPRITPVVDMSDVDSAANSVNGMFNNGLSARMSQVGRNIANLDAAASGMRALSESRANISQDVYEVNIYPQPGMDEEALADAVIVRLNSGVVRKGVALG